MLSLGTAAPGPVLGWSAVEIIILLACAVVTAFTPVMLAILAYRQRAMAEAAASRVEAVRADLRTTAGATDQKLEAIRKSVDGERTKMVERFEAMHAEILRLTSANVTLRTEARNGS